MSTLPETLPEADPRRLLERGRFASTEELKQRILELIDFFNKTLAKPFRWTYIGKPLMA